jgi:hypothetical protein
MGMAALVLNIERDVTVFGALCAAFSTFHVTFGELVTAAFTPR